MTNKSTNNLTIEEKIKLLKKVIESAQQVCDCCEILDDMISMYVAIDKNGEVEVICEECAQDHKDEYKRIIPVTDIVV